MFGAIISATDPVSVVSLLKEKGRSVCHEHIAFRISTPA